MLINVRVLPVCGAHLPRPVPTGDSQCQAERRLVDDVQHHRLHGYRLHVDHIIPHNGDDRLRLDPKNLQLLCIACHSAKTTREQGR